LSGMEIHYSLDEAARRSRRCVVTIGSFDGIHLAHRELLRRVCECSRENQAASVAITFHPHPVHVLAPPKAPPLLTPLPIKLELMEQSGIDRLLILPFTEELSRWSPEKFVEEVLSKTLGAVEVVVGENFHFGHGQAGTPQVMQELGRRYNFHTEIVPNMSLRKMTVSSSQIRSLLEAGKIPLANRLLGRPFSVRNVVQTGLGIGRTQTVPTLNLGQYTELLPAVGVYVTRVKVWSTAQTELSGENKTEAPSPSRLLRSVTNVGRRPTFGERELGVETHLLEPWEGPPASRMEVSFLYRLRDERKFDSPGELKSQILKDVRRAENYFRRLERFGVDAAEK